MGELGRGRETEIGNLKIILFQHELEHIMSLNANLKYSFNLKEETSRKFQVLWNMPRLSTAEGVCTAPWPVSWVVDSAVLPPDSQWAHHQLNPWRGIVKICHNILNSSCWVFHETQGKKSNSTSKVPNSQLSVVYVCLSICITTLDTKLLLIWKLKLYRHFYQQQSRASEWCQASVWLIYILYLYAVLKVSILWGLRA